MDSDGLWGWVYYLVGAHEGYGQDGMPEVTSILYCHMHALLNVPIRLCEING